MHQRPPVCFPACSCTATDTGALRCGRLWPFGVCQDDEQSHRGSMLQSTVDAAPGRAALNAPWHLRGGGTGPPCRWAAGGAALCQGVLSACWRGQRSIGMKDDDPKKRQLSSWGNLTFGDPRCRPFLPSRDSLIHSKERRIHCFYLTYQSNKNHH